MAEKHTTADYVEALRLAQDHTHAAAAAILGVSKRNFQVRLAAAKGLGLTADTPVIDEKERLKIALNKAQRDIRNLAREADTAEAIRREIYALASRDPAPPPWLVAADKKANSRGCPVTIWSDWHFGEVVRPEEVGGVNEFNAEIAAARAEALCKSIVELSFNHMGRAEKKYPGIVVCLGGDMITGDIHEELTATNDRTTQQCINDLTDILAAAIGRMADAFGKVFVPCVVGNHGRSTRKPRMKGRVYTSHEWNIYCNLARYFRQDKRVAFLIPNESDAYFKVYGHRFLLTHGDSLGVKGGDGIIGAIGPIMRGSIKTAKAEAQVGRDFDTLLIGHWHTMLWLPGVIVNGALKGYDEYARLAIRAPYGPPSQALFFVHPEHGITARWEVLLDKHRQVGDTSKWLEWQTAA